MTIEGRQTLLVVADYLRKKLIEPLDERRRQEAQQSEREAEQRQEEARARGQAAGQARTQAVWEAWNERRMAAQAQGESFDEPPPGTTAAHKDE